MDEFKTLVRDIRGFLEQDSKHRRLALTADDNDASALLLKWLRPGDAHPLSAIGH